ncbi:MAG: hypothetical protein ACI8R1_001910 [Psychrobacter glaciei]|jgi:hypothetical protein
MKTTVSTYSQSNIKKIQLDWDEFFAASVGIGTASQKNSSQFRVIKQRIHLLNINYN